MLSCLFTQTLSWSIFSSFIRLWALDPLSRPSLMLHITISAWDASNMFHKPFDTRGTFRDSHSDTSHAKIPLNPTRRFFDYVINFRWLPEAHPWQLPCLGAPDDCWTPTTWSLALLHRQWVHSHGKTGHHRSASRHIYYFKAHSWEKSLWSYMKLQWHLPTEWSSCWNNYGKNRTVWILWPWKQIG